MTASERDGLVNRDASKGVHGIGASRMVGGQAIWTFTRFGFLYTDISRCSGRTWLVRVDECVL